MNVFQQLIRVGNVGVSVCMLFFESLSSFIDLISLNFSDGPAPLSSHRGLSMPVEASIEDLHNINDQPSRDGVEADAKVLRNPSELEEKLNREFHYHKHGNYTCNNQPESAQGLYKNASNPFLQNSFNHFDNAIRHPAQEKSSVHSWTKQEPVQHSGQIGAFYRPTSGLYESINSGTSNPSHLHTSVSTPSLPQYNQQHPHSHLDRQQSLPAYPVSDTFDPNLTFCHPLTTSKSGPLQDPGT